MISPYFLNSRVEIFTERQTRGVRGENVKSLVPWLDVPCCCDLKAVRKEAGVGMHQSSYTAKVYVDGPLDITNRHWARVTETLSGITILGQVADCRHAGLCGDNIEFVIESVGDEPPVETAAGGEDA